MKLVELARGLSDHELRGNLIYTREVKARLSGVGIKETDKAWTTLEFAESVYSTELHRRHEALKKRGKA